MTISSVDRTVGPDNVPWLVRARSSLPAPDYADHFTLDTGATATPERWARAMFGDVPSLGEQVIWRVVLGFRLAAGRSPDTIGGWRVGGRGESWIRLEATSWYLTGNLIVSTGPGQVSLTTLLRYGGGLGRTVWPPLAVVHRHLVPGLLRSAAARLRPDHS
jgi:hypothetical protein